jgi:ribulose-phosphate 3-epimerase
MQAPAHRRSRRDFGIAWNSIALVQEAPMTTTRAPVAIVPSVLPADFARLGDEMEALQAAGADRIQWDVMDGQFVPNLTFGPDIVAAARKHCSLPFEAHLMVLTPELLAPRWIEAGCERLIVHVESTVHLHRCLAEINSLGARAAVALNPSTPAGAVSDVLDLVDLVLVMTVNPGFGGQSYITSMERKIAQVRAMIDDSGRRIELEVDGGIGSATIGGASTAGADAFIAGSALFRHLGGLAAGVSELRALAQAARR